VLTYVISLISFRLTDALPKLMVGIDYSRNISSGIAPAIWLLTLLALVAQIYYKRGRTVPNLWLSLALLAWLMDITLIHAAGSRFSVGWYMGRINTILTSSVVLVALIYEISQLYYRLSLREKELRTFIQFSPLGVAQVTPDGFINGGNRALLDLLGYSHEELRQNPFYRFAIPEDRGRVSEIFDKLTAGKNEQLRLEYRFKRKDGNILWLALTVSLVRLRFNRPGYFIVMMDDISEQKKAEQSRHFLLEATGLLNSSLNYEENLKTVSELALQNGLGDYCILDVLEQDLVSPDSRKMRLRRVAVAHKDPGKATLVQQIDERFRPEKYPSHPLAQALSGNGLVVLPRITDEYIQAISYDEEYDKVIRELQPFSAIIINLKVGERTLGILSLINAETRREYDSSDIELAQELARRVATAIDNSRLYRQLQNALAVRQEFVLVASHELKTPVTSLRGFAQLLLRQLEKNESLDPERLRKALTTIDLQSSRLSRLVSRLLDISRLESGRLVLERELIDVTALVEQLVGEAQIGAQRHTILSNLKPGLKAFLDPLRFEQVVSNLLDNAVKYSPPDSQIEVTITEESDNNLLCLCVKDQGSGIAHEHRPFIFDPFYQAQNQVHGLGLGLYISQQIISIHGGTIEAQYPPDGGTIFIVKIPTVHETTAVPVNQILSEETHETA
jgi:PAS domain S-box-containing protein